MPINLLSPILSISLFKLSFSVLDRHHAAWCWITVQCLPYMQYYIITYVWPQRQSVFLFFSLLSCHIFVTYDAWKCWTFWQQFLKSNVLPVNSLLAPLINLPCVHLYTPYISFLIFYSILCFLLFFYFHFFRRADFSYRTEDLQTAQWFIYRYGWIPPIPIPFEFISIFSLLPLHSPFTHTKSHLPSPLLITSLLFCSLLLGAVGAPLFTSCASTHGQKHPIYSSKQCSIPLHPTYPTPPRAHWRAFLSHFCIISLPFVWFYFYLESVIGFCCRVHACHLAFLLL